MMQEEKLFSFANRWFSTSVGVTLAVFLFSAIMGFVVLPYAEPDSRIAGIWESICNAAGFPTSRSDEPMKPSFTVSTADVGSVAPQKVSATSVGRGATLAQQCAICHGPTGVSRADSPNLAGQYAAAIYKQLHDFKTGARSNAVMTPFALNMPEQDMRDLAAYYAFLPRLPGRRSAGHHAAPTIVASGAPMRGIAPCGSCHGDIENKLASPWLGGQSAVYIKSQLMGFRNGTRRNDTSQQMRNIARAMTIEEIDTAAHFFASLQ
jgi:cytochrome c553